MRSRNQLSNQVFYLSMVGLDLAAASPIERIIAVYSPHKAIMEELPSIPKYGLDLLPFPALQTPNPITFRNISQHFVENPHTS